MTTRLLFQMCPDFRLVTVNIHAANDDMHPIALQYFKKPADIKKPYRIYKVR
jgi:hypothetical protein